MIDQADFQSINFIVSISLYYHIQKQQEDNIILNQG